MTAHNHAARAAISERMACPACRMSPRFAKEARSRLRAKEVPDVMPMIRRFYRRSVRALLGLPEDGP